MSKPTDYMNFFRTRRRGIIVNKVVENHFYELCSIGRIFILYSTSNFNECFWKPYSRYLKYSIHFIPVYCHYEIHSSFDCENFENLFSLGIGQRLAHFIPQASFYSARKCQKIKGIFFQKKKVFFLKTLRRF